MSAEVSPRLKRLMVVFLAILTWAIVSLIALSSPTLENPTSMWLLAPFPVAYAMFIPLLWWRYKSAFPAAMAVLIVGIIVIILGIAQAAAIADYPVATWLFFALILKAVAVFFCYTAYREIK
jgi:hypothetical protein